MKIEDKERIEKEALDFAVSKDVATCSYHHGCRVGYIAGATAEHERNRMAHEDELNAEWENGHNAAIKEIPEELKQEWNKAIDECYRLTAKYQIYDSQVSLLNEIQALKIK